jgi:hypothetical protein
MDEKKARWLLGSLTEAAELLEHVWLQLDDEKGFMKKPEVAKAAHYVAEVQLGLIKQYGLE